MAPPVVAGPDPRRSCLKVESRASVSAAVAIVLGASATETAAEIEAHQAGLLERTCVGCQTAGGKA